MNTHTTTPAPFVTLELATTEARKQIRRDDGAGRDAAWLSYLSPDQRIELRCTVADVDAYEQDTGRTLPADVLEGGAFAHLLNWLTANAGLRVFHCYASHG